MSNLRNARERLGLTQKQVADLIDGDQSAISRYENGNRPDVDVAPKLAAVLGIPLLDILYPKRDAA